MNPLLGETRDHLRPNEHLMQLSSSVPVFCFRCQPSDYELKSKKKGALRFWTPFIKDQLKRLATAEEQLVDAQRDQVRRVVWEYIRRR